jgi:hypothetical protein
MVEDQNRTANLNRLHSKIVYKLIQEKAAEAYKQKEEERRGKPKPEG